MSSSSLVGAEVTVVERIAEIRSLVTAARERGEIVGLVPTMGALHRGHLSLMDQARRECDLVVASIFVNPTQFGPSEDFARYPRNLATDLRLCGQAGVDVVFHPAASDVYPPGFATFVDVGGLAGVLEGAFRPGHFRGVATVVLKLFQMVPASIAYFGQKDYQQQTVIRRLARDLDLAIEIRTCPTIREPDGLALSSRNVYLNPQERQAARLLSESLHRAAQLVRDGADDLDRVREAMREVLRSSPLVQPDYATLVHPTTLEEVATPLPTLVALVAARVGTTRLIDNEVISLADPLNPP
ncbi:MAG: pantoate--beta-alanine ligase [Planctomycetales bacterium]